MNTISKGELREILTKQSSFLLLELIHCVNPTKDELIAIILDATESKLTEGVRAFGWDFKIK